eukprot:g25066.t1
MLQRQLAPSVVTLAALVEALGPPRWAKALQVLEESRRFTVVPDLVLVNATASVACRGSSWTTALALAEGLPQRALQADVFTANIVLSSLAQNKGWQDTLAMLHSLPRRLAWAQQWHQVLALLEQSEDSARDDLFRASYMASCLDAGDLPTALAGRDPMTR